MVFGVVILPMLKVDPEDYKEMVGDGGPSRAALPAATAPARSGSGSRKRD